MNKIADLTLLVDKYNSVFTISVTSKNLSKNIIQKSFAKIKNEQNKIAFCLS